MKIISTQLRNKLTPFILLVILVSCSANQGGDSSSAQQSAITSPTVMDPDQLALAQANITALQSALGNYQANRSASLDVTTALLDQIVTLIEGIGDSITAEAIDLDKGASLISALDSANTNLLQIAVGVQALADEDLSVPAISIPSSSTSTTRSAQIPASTGTSDLNLADKISKIKKAIEGASRNVGNLKSVIEEKQLTYLQSRLDLLTHSFMANPNIPVDQDAFNEAKNAIFVYQGRSDFSNLLNKVKFKDKLIETSQSIIAFRDMNWKNLSEDQVAAANEALELLESFTSDKVKEELSQLQGVYQELADLKSEIDQGKDATSFAMPNLENTITAIKGSKVKEFVPGIYSSVMNQASIIKKSALSAKIETPILLDQFAESFQLMSGKSALYSKANKCFLESLELSNTAKNDLTDLSPNTKRTLDDYLKLTDNPEMSEKINFIKEKINAIDSIVSSDGLVNFDKELYRACAEPYFIVMKNTGQLNDKKVSELNETIKAKEKENSEKLEEIKKLQVDFATRKQEYDDAQRKLKDDINQSNTEKAALQAKISEKEKSLDDLNKQLFAQIEANLEAKKDIDHLKIDKASMQEILDKNKEQMANDSKTMEERSELIAQNLQVISSQKDQIDTGLSENITLQQKLLQTSEELKKLRSDHEKVSENLNQVQESMLALNATNQLQNLQIDSQTEELDKLSKSYEDLESEKSIIEANLETKNKYYEGLLTNYQNDLADKGEELQKARSDLASAQAQFENDLQDSQSKADAALKAKQDEISEAQTKLGTILRELSGKYQSLSEVYEKSSEQNQVDSASISSLNSAIASLESAKTQGLEIIDKLSEETKRLNTLTKDLEDRNSGLSQQLQSKSAEAEGLISSLADNAKTLKSAQDELAQKKSDYESLSTKFDTAQTNLTNLISQKDSLIKQLQQSNDSLNTQTATLNQNLSSVNAQIVSLNAQIMDVNAAKREIQTKLESANQDLLASLAKVKALEGSVSNLTLQVSTLTASNNNLTNQLKTATEQASSYKSQLEAANKANTSLTTQLATASQTNTSLTTQLATATQKNTDLTKAKEDLTTANADLTKAKSKAESDLATFKDNLGKFLTQIYATFNLAKSTDASIGIAGFIDDSKGGCTADTFSTCYENVSKAVRNLYNQANSLQKKINSCKNAATSSFSSSDFKLSGYRNIVYQYTYASNEITGYETYSCWNFWSLFTCTDYSRPIYVQRDGYASRYLDSNPIYQTSSTLVANSSTVGQTESIITGVKLGASYCPVSLFN